MSTRQTPTPFWLSEEKARKVTDLSYSIGLVIDKDAAVTQVIWDGPTFASGITVGTTILAVDGRAYDADALKTAITTAATSGKPMELLVKKGDRYLTVPIPYKDGLKYPRLEKVADRRNDARPAAGAAAIDRCPGQGSLAFSALFRHGRAFEESRRGVRTGRRQRSAYGRT